MSDDEPAELLGLWSEPAEPWVLPAGEWDSTRLFIAADNDFEARLTTDGWMKRVDGGEWTPMDDEETE